MLSRCKVPLELGQPPTVIQDATRNCTLRQHYTPASILSISLNERYHTALLSHMPCDDLCVECPCGAVCYVHIAVVQITELSDTDAASAEILQSALPIQ